MSDHHSVKVDQIAIEISDRVDDPSTSEYDKFIGLEHFDSGSLSISRFDGVDNIKSSMKTCLKGDTLVARRNVYLKRASLSNLNAVCSGDAIVLREKPGIVKGLLPLIFNTDSFWNYALTNADGTMSKRLSVKHLLEYEFLLPCDSVIEKVVDTVWKLDKLLDTYVCIINELDLLIKSRFIEMFGHNSYEEKQLSQIFKTASGGTPLNGKKEYYENGTIPWLTSGEVNADHIVEAKSKITELALKETSAKIPPINSVLVSMYGSIGYAGILEFESAINQAICAIYPNPSFMPEWICHFMRSKKDELVNLGAGGTLKNISQEKIQKLSVPMVPLEEQKKFTDFVRQVDKSKVLTLMSCHNSFPEVC